MMFILTLTISIICPDAWDIPWILFDYSVALNLPS